MVKKIALASFLSCLVLGIVLLQCIPCEAGWLRTYGGTSADHAYAFQQSADGGYILAGRTNSFGEGQYDAWLLKLNGGGEIAWQKTYGGVYNDLFSFIRQTTDGGYIVAGETDPSGLGSPDVWLVKLGVSGDVIWQKTYGGSGFDDVNFAWETSDGGYVVGGYTDSFDATSGDLWLIKVDGSGNVVWQKTYDGGAKFDDPMSYSQTTDGGYIMAGRTYSVGAGGSDVWVVKLSENGAVEWNKAYGGTKDDEASSIQQTTDGGYIVAGTTRSFGTGSGDAWLLKIDGTGNIEWQRTIGGLESESALETRQTADGGYLAVGSASSFGAGNADVWFMKLDENGSAGSCPFEDISSLIVTDTEAVMTEATVTSGTTSAAAVDTTMAVSESTATSCEICPLIEKPFFLKVGATGKRKGDGTIKSYDGLIDCPDECQAGYNPGFRVTLLANPSPLSTFLGWKPFSLGCEGTDSCQVTMDKRKSVKAIFQGPNKLKVVTTFKKGAAGTVTSGDGLINCPTDCEELYILNAPVTVTATAGDGSSFVKWTGRPCKDILTNECTFTMDKNATVKAIFQVNPE